MKIYTTIVFVCFIGLSTLASAYPVLDAVVGLPNPELVTVYPDDVDPNLYYFLPTAVELVRDQDGKPRLGVQYWGFTGTDMSGLGAALTFSVRPSFDREKLQAVADEVRKRNPNARWAAIPVICSRMEVILNSAFFPENQTIQNTQSTPGNNVPPVTAAAAAAAAAAPAPTPAAPQTPAPTTGTTPTTDSAGVVSADPVNPPSFCPATAGTNTTLASRGGSVDAIQAFSIELGKVGARAFAIKAGSDMDVLGSRYTYVFRGVGKRLHAKITVHTNRVYDHFKATASATAWWGLVSSSWSTDWQSLTNDGSITVQILEGGSSDSNDYMMEVFKLLVTAKINGTGMFKPELQPGGISGAPEAAKFGWGFSGGGGWEHLTEVNDLSFEIQRRSLEEREFSAALTFNAVCAKYPNNFADLTVPGKKCMDPKLLKNVGDAVSACLNKRLAEWKDRLDKGLITQTVWEHQVATVSSAPCY